MAISYCLRIAGSVFFKGTVRDNIRLGKLTATDSEIDSLTAKLGMAQLCAREITGGDDLSGGEKQRISIARALLKNTDMIFLDEPSNNLDADTRNWLADLIRESTKTMIYISHDDDLTSCADQVIRLNKA